jgi:hypothetical protein
MLHPRVRARDAGIDFLLSVDSHLPGAVTKVLCGGLRQVSRDHVFLSADELSFGEMIG